MINFKKIFIPLFLFFIMNPVHGMSSKEEIENELKAAIDSVIFVKSRLGSYEATINVPDLKVLHALCTYLNKKEHYPFSRLVLSGDVGDDGAQLLAGTLETDKGLRSLNLEDCNIGSEGAEKLAKSISILIQEDKNKFL